MYIVSLSFRFLLANKMTENNKLPYFILPYFSHLECDRLQKHCHHIYSIVYLYLNEFFLLQPAVVFQPRFNFTRTKFTFLGVSK